MRLFAPPDVEKLEARRDVKGLLKVMARDRDAGRRGLAAWALGGLGDPRAVPALVEALGDTDWNIRAVAAKALGQLADLRAVEPLIAALHDDTTGVWTAAVDSLAKLSDPRAAGPLVSLLGETHDYDWPHYSKHHSAVMAALLGIGAPCVDPLIGALADENAYARGEAARALGEIGDPRAAPALVPLLHDKYPAVRLSAASALGRLGWRPHGDEESVAYRIAKREWAKLGARALEPLIELLGDHDKDEREKAAQTLGRLGDARAVPALVPILLDQGESVHKTVAEALDALGWTPDSDEASVAYRIAKWDWKGCVQLGAGAVEPLIRLLENRNQGAGSRLNAAETLGEIADARAVEPLIATLTGSDDIDVRRAAAKALVDLYHSGKLDTATKAQILAQRDTITYKDEEPDWDEERFGNQQRWEDRSIGVAFPL